MNINQILSIIFFTVITAALISCSKEGCTDPNASNYDADAKTSNNDLCEYNYEVPETYVCKKYKIEMVDGLGEKIRSSSSLTGIKEIK